MSLSDNFATPTGWRYFRNTWLTAAIAAALTVGSCSLAPRPAFSAEEAPHHPILVFVVWTDAQNHMISAELAGLAPNPETCYHVSVEDAAAHIDDWTELKAKGLTPHLACGFAVPDAVFNSAGAPTPAPHDGADRCGSPEASELIQGCHQFQIKHTISAAP